MTSVPGRVALRGLRCPPVLVDVVVHTDLGPAARSNDLADAVDIADLAMTVRACIAEAPERLLESHAVRCAEALLARFPSVDHVELRIAKPDPPGLDAAEEVVELTLSR